MRRDRDRDRDDRGRDRDKLRKRRGRRKVCRFCADHAAFIDFKNVGRLRQFVNDRGCIMPRRQTGTCSIHQRELTSAIKRAREMALLPFVVEDVTR